MATRGKRARKLEVKTKGTTILFPPSVHKAVKHAAVDADCSMSDWVVRACLEALEEK